MGIRKFLVLTVTAILAVAAVAALVAAIAVYRLKTPHPIASSTVEIPAGAGTGRIGSILESEGIIDSGAEFTIWTRILGEDCGLEAGVYDFHGHVSLEDVIGRLAEGVPGIDPAVTIPEGLTIAETAALLFADAPRERAAFISIAEDPGPRLRTIAGIGENSLEGYLFPDTYRFREPLDPREVIRTLVENWASKVTPAMRKRAGNRSFGLTGAVILASIIEKEAVLDEERTLISAVYNNRLRLGWKLEADPTVAYAFNKKGCKLTTLDLKTDAPYNTYTRTGLPPGPICSPGLASIRAALAPAPDKDIVYFVASGEGGRHRREGHA